MFGSLRQILHRDSAPELTAEGRIVEIQKPSTNGSGEPHLEFKLDSQSDLVFHQSVSALSSGHKRGDHVVVHYETARDNPHVGTVRWIESRES